MTNQVREKITINGEEFLMEFWDELPEHPRIKKRENWPPEHPDLDELDDPNDIAIFHMLLCSTACHRGYEGHWTIDNEKLFLIGIEGEYVLDGNEPLLAYWYSGTFDVLVEFPSHRTEPTRIKRITVDKGSVTEIKEGAPEVFNVQDKRSSKLLGIYGFILSWFGK